MLAMLREQGGGIGGCSVSESKLVQPAAMAPSGAGFHAGIRL